MIEHSTAQYNTLKPYLQLFNSDEADWGQSDYICDQNHLISDAACQINIIFITNNKYETWYNYVDTTLYLSTTVIWYLKSNNTSRGCDKNLEVET